MLWSDHWLHRDLLKMNAEVEELMKSVRFEELNKRLGELQSLRTEVTRKTREVSQSQLYPTLHSLT